MAGCSPLQGGLSDDSFAIAQLVARARRGEQAGVHGQILAALAGLGCGEVAMRRWVESTSRWRVASQQFDVMWRDYVELDVTVGGSLDEWQLARGCALVTKSWCEDLLKLLPVGKDENVRLVKTCSAHADGFLEGADAAIAVLGGKALVPGGSAGDNAIPRLLRRWVSSPFMEVERLTLRDPKDSVSRVRFKWK